MQLKVFDTTAKEVGKLKLSDSVFGAEYNEPLIHQVVVAYLANQRQGTKCTLTRSEVRGGGKKPYRQKGTGNARQGSTRSPQYTGGGVVFAPKPRDFSKKVNKRMKFEAFKSALSQKAKNDEILVLDKLELSAVKTKQMQNVLDSFKLDKRVLLVLDEHNEDILRASRNIPNLTVTNTDLVNVYELVANGKVLLTQQSVKNLEEAFAE
jgi:large subunit ribosomal protein L4